MQLARVLTTQAVEGETRKIIDLHVAANRAKQDHVARCVVHAIRQGFDSGEDRIFRCFENTVQTPHDNEGQNDLAIFGLLEITAQDFRD